MDEAPSQQETDQAASDGTGLLAQYVYLDASTYMRQRFDWGGRLLGACGELAQRGLIQVVVTEVTRREVEALMHEGCSKLRKTAQQYGLARNVLGLPDEQECFRQMTSAFDGWLKRCRAWTCNAEPNLPTILDDYFAGNPPFGTNEKDQSSLTR